MGWFYGFKLHIIVNDQGELLNVKLTKANADVREPVPNMTLSLWGKLFGDKDYIKASNFLNDYAVWLAINRTVLASPTSFRATDQELTISIMPSQAKPRFLLAAPNLGSMAKCLNAPLTHCAGK